MVSHLAGRRALRVVAAVALVVALLCPTRGVAQAPAITADGTLGTLVGRLGDAYSIDGGTIRGNNLFHSFGLFNVPTGGSATFLGPSSIANIISRVTGGQQSTIDGLISTRASMPNASFFLINPSGVLFTSGASLDVGGAFRVSTADNIRLADGAVFSATPVPGELGLLTSAPPQAFGFLGNNLGAISVQGAVLVVDPGQTLSLVGGDVQISGGALIAPGGLVQIGSVASPGNALLSPPDLNLGSFAQLGQVSISDGAFVTAGSDGVLPGGTVAIRSGRLVVDNGAVITTNTFDVAGVPVGIDLGATESIALRNGAVVRTESFGAGDASDISIVTGNLAVTDGAFVESGGFGAGRPGNIDIHVGGADIVNGTIKTSSSATGSDIAIDAADTVTISGPTGEISTGTFAFFPDPLTGGIPFAGNISVSAGNVVLSDQAKIRSGSAGAGIEPGQSLRITATDSVTISGLAGIENQAFAQNAGTVEITAQSLAMNAGYINTSTLGAGNAGPILVNANRVSLSKGAQIASSSQIVAPGAGGDITINAPNSVTIAGVGPVDGVGSITFTGNPKSGLFSSTSAFGPSGNININTGKLQISGGAIVTAESTGTAAVLGGSPGNAGNIHIVIGDTLRMDGGTVTTAAAEATGGDITITHTGSLLHMTNSQITTSVSGGDGKGGNITIGAALDPVTLDPVNVNPFDLIVLNNSGIHANAFGGPGGNINIFTDVLLSSLPLASAITASSALNTPGTIDIQATVTQFTSNVSQLPEAPLQATELLRATCAARVAAGRSSSLVLGGRGGLPLEPGGLLPSPLYLGVDAAISLDNHDRPDERLTFSPSNFSMLASDNERPLLRARGGWDQFQLAKTTLGLDCSR